MSLRNRRWRDVLRVLKNHGFMVDRQRGDYIHLSDNRGRYVTLPRKDPIKEGTLKSILDQAGISREQFLQEI